MRVRYSLIPILAVALIAASAPSHATTTSYVANLSGANEVPPNASPATGTGFVVYDDVANSITTSVTYSGLLANMTATHIHGPALAGANAPVIHFLATTSPPIGTQSGSYNDVWDSSDSPALSAVHIGYLTTQKLYINIHTTQFPGGEIRGQIVPAATPARAVSWGRIKNLYR